uniref:Uncharacterized protein n=1 Tax=Kwoniella pini CBS 10737 TaxID=1296096 RepID=A0A1B9HZT3_9TREE|nr:uncharacterized protein I206_05588 [Kwoniella pini CBS 10737]OCF48807.1 hypothetical protein I206_05588 [Kwoniella pini CBS 10737]
MVQIKSSVLVAAAAISASTSFALPTSNSNNNLDLDILLNGNSNGNSASPTKSSAFGESSTLMNQPTGKAVVDVNVNLDKAQPLLQARRERKEVKEDDGGLKRSVKEMVKNVEGKGNNEIGSSTRLWKGKPSKRGPWRSDGNNLIDLDIGHGAVESYSDHPNHLVNNDLLDIAIRSPKHVDKSDSILTGDNHDYYRNSGHRNHNRHGNSRIHHDHSSTLHARHHGNRHSVVEVIGDGYRHGRHDGVEFIDTGRTRHGGYGYVNGDVNVHNHVHERSHDGVVVMDGDRHRHGAVTVIDGHRPHGDTTIIDGHRHGDTTIVNNDRHHGDTTVVNNGHYRGDTTVVNNHKRSPKLGISSKFASLGRAFLKRSHSHEERHDHHGDATIIAGGGHDDTTIVNGRHGDTTLVNGGRHGDTLIVDNDRHHHGGDTTIVNNDRHHDTTVVNNGRHGDTTVVNNDGHRHHGDTTVVNNHKRHHRSDRIVVVGDSRRYKDADFYRKNSWDNGLRYGRPIYFSDGGSFNRIKMVDNDYPHYHGGSNVNIIPGDAIPYRADGRYGHGRYSYYGKRDGDEVEDVKRHHDEDVTIVNNNPHNGHHGHHDNKDGDDVTVVNNHKRHHNDDNRDDSHHDRNECRHGRCDTHHDDNVTVVNNHKRQVADSGMGGAPGYIDVTSPVFNSTTAARIASLVLSTSNGTDANSTFVLNASSNIRTQVYLVPLNQTASSASVLATGAAASTNTTSTIPVNLKVPIFVAASASVEPYCATFDPSPENPAPLTVTPCTEDDSSTHESQKFLYNPDTGVIHPDWQPSTEAQQLLQAVPDSIDDTSASNDTSMSTTSVDQSSDMDLSSSQMVQAETYVGDSLPTATASITASMFKRQDSTPTDTSTSMYSPPPLITSGPQNSTDSTNLPQSNGNGTGGASNVTLIFTPSNPAIVNSASVNFDQSSDNQDTTTSQNEMDSQQATMSKRGWSNPDINGNDQNFGSDNYQSQSQIQSNSSDSGSNSNLNTVNQDVNSNDNGDSSNSFSSTSEPKSQTDTSVQAQNDPASDSDSDSGSSASPWSQGLHAEANVAINAFKTDSLLQKVNWLSFQVD